MEISIKKKEFRGLNYTMDLYNIQRAINVQRNKINLILNLKLGIRVALGNWTVVGSSYCQKAKRASTLAIPTIVRAKDFVNSKV